MKKLFVHLLLLSLVIFPSSLLAQQKLGDGKFAIGTDQDPVLAPEY